MSHLHINPLTFHTLVFLWHFRQLLQCLTKQDFQPQSPSLLLLEFVTQNSFPQQIDALS